MNKIPIKWRFKFCYHCASKTGYLYQFDLYLGEKESREEKFGPHVVLALTECLEGTYCTIFFDNFFNNLSLSSSFLTKIFTELVLLEWIGMPKMRPHKQMKRGEYKYRFTGKVSCCKWFDR